jgi:hypothetical protein
MKHLLRILEIQHIREGKVLWEAFDLPNTLHLDGEEFILSSVFRTTSGIVIPSFFYVGMDNRGTVTVTDNMYSLTTEPQGNGYSRQPVSSATGFTIEQFVLPGDTTGINHWRAKSGIVSFTAVGAAWGPVSNVFLTDRLDNTGYLISTAPLGTTRSVSPGDNLTFRFALNVVDVNSITQGG